MLAYISSASVSDRPEDSHCLLYLSRLVGSLTVMTAIPQLRTGSCVKTIMYTTKGPTHKYGNKITCKRESLIPIPRILYAYQIQVYTNKITRTLQDIKSQKGWHSIQVSPLTTYKNKTPRSKIAQNTLQGRYSIRESPLAANENKTSNPEINGALPSTY